MSRRLFTQLVAAAQLPISRLWTWPLLMTSVQCRRNSVIKLHLVSHNSDDCDYTVAVAGAAAAAADYNNNNVIIIIIGGQKNKIIIIILR